MGITHCHTGTFTTVLPPLRGYCLCQPRVGHLHSQDPSGFRPGKRSGSVSFRESRTIASIASRDDFSLFTMNLYFSKEDNWIIFPSLILESPVFRHLIYLVSTALGRFAVTHSPFPSAQPPIISSTNLSEENVLITLSKAVMLEH